MFFGVWTLIVFVIAWAICAVSAKHVVTFRARARVIQVLSRGARHVIGACRGRTRT